jgi:hypothetical protein
MISNHTGALDKNVNPHESYQTRKICGAKFVAQPAELPVIDLYRLRAVEK